MGGNTGLVGGTWADEDEIILTTERMNAIEGFDETLGAVRTQAGVVLQTLDDFARTKKCVMPLDLGSKGSCMIGGNLATNAGGIRLIRFGSLRGSVLGIKVVTGDGTILDGMRTLRKDNVGYDLKQCFIGSEGTLGIITDCIVLTPPMPLSQNLCVLRLKNFQTAIQSLRLAKSMLGEILSAFEYFDGHSLNLVTNISRDTTNPFPKFNQEQDYFVLIETMGSNEGHDKEKMETFLERAQEALGEGMLDGVLSQSGRETESLWKLRENITSSLKKTNLRVFKYDISLPSTKLDDATQFVKSKLIDAFRADDLNVYQYGHLGDGNLHFNCSCSLPSRQEQEVVRNLLEHHLYDYVAKARGSISAEHGLGKLKASKIEYSRSPEEVKYMKMLKQVFDPKGIMNPGKVLI